MARRLAVVCGCNARRTSEASIDGSGASKRTVQPGSLWAVKDKRRHLCEAGKVRRSRIIGDHARGDAVQQWQFWKSQGPCNIDTALMGNLLRHGFSLLPFIQGTSN